MKHLLFTLCILFVFCTSDKTTEQSTKDSVAAMAAPPASIVQKKDSIISLETAPDTSRLAVLKHYQPLWKKTACLPIPPESILLIHEDSYEEPLYRYIVTVFDSISEKQTTQYYVQEGAEPDEEDPTDACAWEQQFSNGIIYSSSYCNENGGGAITIHTRCRDKETLVYLIDILYHDPAYTWNADSTVYSSIDEIPGCSYQIDKDDKGFYYVAIYCGGC